MDIHTINPEPYHDGGRFGPGQEVYYAVHRVRLWKWYCRATHIPFHIKDSYPVYKKKKEILQAICDSLGLPRDGKIKELIAYLDRYEFTTEQALSLDCPFQV